LLSPRRVLDENRLRPDFQNEVECVRGESRVRIGAALENQIAGRAADQSLKAIAFVSGASRLAGIKLGQTVGKRSNARGLVVIRRRRIEIETARASKPFTTNRTGQRGAGRADIKDCGGGRR